MRRRDFAYIVGGAMLALPLELAAQAPRAPRWRVGLLNYSEPEPNRVRLWRVLRDRLGELGYVEGQNIVFESRWADGHVDRLPALAAELVKAKVDVIVTAGTPTAQVAKRASASIPIVMATGSDPIGAGLVTSLSHPDANLTGVVTQDAELPPKRLALLRELLPGASRIANLVDTSYPSSALATRETERAARALGISLHVLSARNAREVDAAFQSMLNPRVHALIIQPSGLFVGERKTLAGLAMKHGIPTMSNERSYAEAGCLMSYGPDFEDNFRRAAGYIDKILRGARPATLPIEQPTKFELVLNLRTAKALGIAIPESLLLRADDVIK